MNADQLQLSESTDLAAWDSLVARSPQGTVFCTSNFLRSLDAPFRLLQVSAGGRTLALLPVVEDASRQAIVRPPYTPYQGLLFVPETRQPPLARQRADDEMCITGFVIGELVRRYRRIELALSWQFADLRPFLWHNYHDSSAGQFRVMPRYTALLAIDAGAGERVRAQSRACRRQEARKAAACSITDALPLDDFLVLYARTFERQSLKVAAGHLSLVRSIAERALASGYGRLAACVGVDGVVAAATLFLYDQRRAYYLFAANDPALRHTGAATRLMFDNIDEACRRGLQEVDFVGVNSPNRGDFKLSFNPELRQYFDLSWAAGPQA